jgi:regulator of replication initiation timing
MKCNHFYKNDKISTKRSLTLLFIFLVINFCHISINCNISDSFLSNSIQNEFEADLMKLISKLHQKKNEEGNRKKDFVTVKIRKVYDLQQTLNQVSKMKNQILKEKNEDHKNLLFNVQKLEKQLSANQKDLSQLKQKNDKVISETNRLNIESNLKRSEEITAKSEYENSKSEYERDSEKFMKNLLHTVKSFNGDFSQNSGHAKIFTNLNKKISSLNSNLDKRNKLQDFILKQKQKTQQTEIELQNLRQVHQESKYDKKLFSLLNANIENNINQINTGYFNSTVALNSLRKIVNDRENRNKLEIEKSQQNEVYRDTNKKIKMYLTELEQVQNSVKDLMKKKNKLKEELNSKEIESGLKIDKLKSEVSDLNKEMKAVEEVMLNNVKDQKTVSKILCDFSLKNI